MKMCKTLPEAVAHKNPPSQVCKCRFSGISMYLTFSRSLREAYELKP